MRSTAFFVREGAQFVPTGLGASPWNPKAHGGVSLCGLVAYCIDRVPSPAPMHVSRITLDLYGAIPLEPIVSSARILREGKRVQLIEIEFEVSGKTWLRATALRLRTIPTPALNRPLNHAPPDITATGRSDLGWVEIFPSTRDLLVPGDGASWLKFPIEVIATQMNSPLQMVAMAADFSFGIASPFSIKEWTYANLDISIHLSRLPRYDWVLIDASSDSAGNGIAVSHARLGDADGMIGMAHQSIFLDRRRS